MPDLDLDSQPRSIQSLYGWFADGSLFVNRRYQRKLVWSLEEKQRLVESVLKKYPIPAILLAEREGGGYEIIDGLQRLHTLMSYIEMRFPDLGDRYFAVAEFPTANSRAKDEVFDLKGDVKVLTEREVGNFLDYTLAISVMRDASDSEIDDVFGRINTYGHRLSNQERRQAGVQNSFSELIRELSCEVRGDASPDEIGLTDMPSISIDLPLSRHGYEVSAQDVFWVEQGILRSTDLRDSMDEQLIADLAACVIGGQMLARSKGALDAVYAGGTEEFKRIESALQTYGSDRFRAEFKFILDEVSSILGGTDQKLRNLLFKNQTTNPFPALFASVFVALHSCLISKNQVVSDYDGLRAALVDLNVRVPSSPGEATAATRQQNVNQIVGLIQPHLVTGSHKDIYGDHTSFDIDQAIQRSEIEAPHYELKQGILRLDDKRKIDAGIFDRIIETLCAIANNGKERAGSLFIGVADKDADVNRIAELDGVQSRKVGKRFVVGVAREAAVLGEKAEDYVKRIRDAIDNSSLSTPLRGAVLSSLAYSEYFGLGVLVLRVPEQTAMSNVGGHVFVRAGDQTKEVTGVEIGDIAMRFA